MSSPARTFAVAPGGQQNTIQLFETRIVYLAQGIQFNNSDLAPWPYMVMPDGLMAPIASHDSDWPKSMKKRAPLAITKTANGFEFTSAAQKVKFDVRLILTKKAFRDALLTPGAHVVYAGHARYGRGPCFGTSDAPGEDWENGTTPATTGLFRMGYPFISVPVKEVLEHGYTANLVESTVKVTADQSDPDLRGHIASKTWLSKKANDIRAGLLSHIRDKDPNKTYWTYVAWEEGKMEPFVVIHAGWENTLSAPNDLGATTPLCRVFCHFGCSTFPHNRAILRGNPFKAWKKDKNDRFAYFTTALANNITAVYWLYHIFTYPKANNFGDWEPSLNFAVGKVNSDLARDGEHYRII